VSVSSKQWFLTFNEEYKELLIWKNGIRLKLNDGSSGGPVEEVAVHDEVDKTVTVSYH
jgi:hypothetical protein